MRLKPFFSVGIFIPITSFVGLSTGQECGDVCSDELTTCLATAGNDAADQQKCHLYHFDCAFLCEDLSEWSCEQHCQSDFDRCVIAEGGVGCDGRRERCIDCCPSAMPSSNPTKAPTTKMPSSNPTLGPSLSLSGVPTNGPSSSFSPTNHLGDLEVAEIDVAIYPESDTTKSVLLPKSDEGILLKLTKIGGNTNVVPPPVTEAPTRMPITPYPTDFPTKSPTNLPTKRPTNSPTSSPVESTAAPSYSPSSIPTKIPTKSPTTTNIPTEKPTDEPTGSPTSQPTQQPTNSPTLQPTNQSTGSPTSQPNQGNFVLLSGSLYDKCPSGTEVAQEDCLATALSLISDISTIANPTSLLVDDWDGIPCGCFIYNNALIDFDFNCENRGKHLAANLVCAEQQVAPTTQPTASSNGNSDYELLSGEAYKKCPNGLEVPQEDCLAVADLLTQDINTISNRNYLHVYDWTFTPCGCFIWDDSLIDYDFNCGNAVFQPSAKLVCKKPTSRKRELSTNNDYIKLSGSLYDKCPSGAEVAQEDCLAAAISVTADISTIRNPTDLLVDDWSALPCGCFIYNNAFIDFDLNCENRGKSWSVDLVCKNVTLSPVSAPTILNQPTATGVPTIVSPTPIPAGRSYDGRSWEKVYPLLMTFSCDASNMCFVDLPPDSTGEGVYYVVERYEPEPPSAKEEAARFLIQTTFGTNRISLDSMMNDYSSASDWIKDQIGVTPLTSHREHYRQRSNSVARNGLEKFGMRNPHLPGSRWNRWAFDRYRDVGKQITLQGTQHSTYIMKIDGIARTEVGPNFADNLVSTGHFNIWGQLYMCRGSSEFASLPEAKLVLGNALESCDMQFNIASIRMPTVEFFDPASLGLDIPVASLEELDPVVLDVKLLASPLSAGSLKKSWPNFVKDAQTSEYYVEDRRIEMLEIDPANVSPQVLSSKTCPSAPKTFLNENTCVVRSDCSPPVYHPSTGVFTLDAANIQRFYDLGGHYVYRINNLPIITDYRSRWETFSPCNDAIQFKRFDTDPFRFVRKDGCSASHLDSSIKTAISQALAAELSQISDLNERNSKRVLDVVMPKNACQDPFKTARGASFTVVVDGALTCWTHSNPDEWSVFNFDSWLVLHPGNLEAFTNHKKNPIADIAESEGSLEDKVTLNMPGWHPDDRFPSYKSNFIYVGNWGDKVNFADMPTSVQEPELASFFGAELIPDAVSGYVEVCASPGEVANDPSLGHQYRLQKADETGEKGNDSLDQDGFGWNGKNRVWNTISTFAPDQLRQRVAWVLSSLIVVTSVDINREHSVEDWSSYHDIFVRNAFGNYFDVLKQVSFHKLMATMLTYHESKSMSHNFEEDGVMIFPDENYAREIMQLFTIGLYKLNQDGTVVIDQNTGEPAETYDNDDIMNFSRAWTNFKNQEQRPNLEVYADFFSFENTIDPMMFPTTDGRDVFPKTGLNDGGRVYIGDKNKRCDAMPPKAWLRKGAKFIFRGSDPNVELGRKDPKYWVDPVWSDPQHYSRVILDETSNLHSELCNADPVTGACRFASTVILANDVDCIGTCNAGEYKQHISGLQPCECSIDEIRTVRVDNPATATGNLPSVWYEYVRDTCVQMAFPEPGYMKAVSEIGTTYPTVANDAMCADTRLATAGTACCDPNNNNSPKNICLFRGERTTYDTAKLRCESNGLVTCPWSTIPINYHCGTDIQWDGDHYKAGMRFSWTNEDCSMKVQIDEKGYVAMVHDVGSLTQQVKGRVRIDVGTYFRVFWDGDSFPTTSNGCEGSSSCEVRGTTCFCSTTVHTSPVFDGSAIITKEQLLTKLHIGAPNPAHFDEGFYFRCTASACISPDFSVYFTQVVDKNNDISQAIDEKTIFEVTDPLTGKTMFLSNTNSMVSVGSGFSFRNPPMFNSPVDQTQRDALAETDAVLHHYVQHSNTAPFIATRLIQHLVTSNPSPRYVGDVAEAFRTGTYSDGVNTFGTGTYGDLEATVASVFLDDEARSTTLDADVTHGRAREPLLKLIHFFRAMELDTEDRRSREVDLIYLKDKIGQESHYAPSVFSFFLAEYQPIGPVLDMNLVAPEAQLFDAPKLIGFLNGMANLPFYGIADCEDGKGFGPFFFSRFKITDHPDERWYQCHEAGSLNPDTHVPHRFRWLPESNASPAEIVSEMDLLLTGGRLSSMNKGIITQAYAVAAEAYGDATALQHAISHFAAAPEFHVTNDLFSNETQLHERTSTVPDIPENPPPVTDYKAIVYIYLQGALDSYSLLMPNVCANGLNTQYHQVRGDIAIANHRHLVINSIGDQPCSKFGVHPEMGYIQQLYNMGEASFVANIGPLFEPIADNIEFKQGTKQVPPSLFAHNVQTAETQGVSTGDATAGGILGRIGDAINMQAGEEVFDAYSVFGTPLALEGAPGVSRPADVLTEVGVSSFTPTPSMFEHNIVEMNKHVADSIYGETFSEAISSAILRKNLLEQSIGDSLLDATTEACFTRLETPISNQFKQVTRIIAQRNNLQSKRDVFYVQLGSFDSHSDNYFGTAEKLSMLNGAIQCFANNMKGNGLWNDVTVMSASEFGRTLTSNGAGTDHAWGGNHFIAGGSIAGGKIHGKYPDDLSENGPLNIGRGRLIPTTSWEGLWKGVAEWFGVESQNMAFVLPNLSNFQTNVFGKTDLYK